MFRIHLAISGIICLLFLHSELVVAQFENCDSEYPCPDNKYCNFDFGDTGGFCEECPSSDTACSNLGLNNPGGVSDCQTVCKDPGPDPEPEPEPDYKVPSPFKVVPVDSDKCKIPAVYSSAMKEQGFVKVACPFGIAIAGTEGFNDEKLKFAANVLANILDQDHNGVADDPKIVELLTYRNKSSGGGVLACGKSEAEEFRGDELGSVFDYSFSCQAWKAEPGEWYTSEWQGIIMEEAFHMVHQLGYAVAHPDELGIDDFTSSVVGREMASLQCVKPGWHHPENDCPAGAPFPPGNPAPSPLQGNSTCAQSSCDIAEFYKMAVFLLNGMGPGDVGDDISAPYMWLSEYMPDTQAGVRAMLSAEFLEMFETPSLHQLSAPLTGEYKVINKTKCKDMRASRFTLAKIGRVPERARTSCKWFGKIWKNKRQKKKHCIRKVLITRGPQNGQKVRLNLVCKQSCIDVKAANKQMKCLQPYYLV